MHTAFPLFLLQIINDSVLMSYGLTFVIFKNYKVILHG